MLLDIHDLVWSSNDFLSVSPDHINLVGDFSFNRVNFVKPFQESNKRIDIPKVINSYFLQHFQISMICNLMEMGMFLRSAHTVEVEVHCDDDK